MNDIEKKICRRIKIVITLIPLKAVSNAQPESSSPAVYGRDSSFPAVEPVLVITLSTYVIILYTYIHLYIYLLINIYAQKNINIYTYAYYILFVLEATFCCIYRQHRAL